MADFDSSDEEDRINNFNIQSLKIDKLELPNGVFAGRGAVYISGLPGCWYRDTRQDLRADINQLLRLGITDTIVLVSKGELRKYRAPSLLAMYALHGISAHHLPYHDGTAPTIDQAMTVLSKGVDLVVAGRTVLLHCICGFGRAGVMGACLLQWLDDGLAPEDSIKQLREMRGNRAVQTVAQYNFVMDFRDNLTRARERSVSR